MPHCQHCGSYVSAKYVRVFGVDGQVKACPECPDRKRKGSGKIKETINDASRRGARTT